MVLLAETDPYTRDFLPPLLLGQLPDVVVDIFSSTEDLRRNLKCWAYDAIAINPILLQDNPFPKNKPDRLVAAPLLVNASRDDREPTSTYLKGEAFDLIVKPIIPQQAAQTVRLALWQNALLRLLSSSERTLLKVQDHLDTFPDDSIVELTVRKRLEVVQRMLRGNTNSSLMSNSAEEWSLFDMAASIAQFTRQRAFEQLLHLQP
ncbi:MAG TPA: hypothetical protein PLO50_09735 [Nitrospira sp.]|nr:hypothetical protein [Nitrospira sp.]